MAPKLDETFWSGAFGILFTATTLTMFEAGFIFKIVIPEVRNSITKSIDELNTESSVLEDVVEKIQNAAVMLGAPMSTKQLNVASDVATRATTDSRAIVSTLKAREEKLRAKVNSAAQMKMGAIVIVLMVATRGAWKAAAPRAAPGKVTERMVAFYTALFTITALIAFQIYFYFVTKSYKFPGSFGNEELLQTVLDPKDAIPGVIKASKWTCSTPKTNDQVAADQKDL